MNAPVAPVNDFVGGAAQETTKRENHDHGPPQGRHKTSFGTSEKTQAKGQWLVAMCEDAPRPSKSRRNRFGCSIRRNSGPGRSGEEYKYLHYRLLYHGCELDSVFEDIRAPLVTVHLLRIPTRKLPCG